MYTLLYGFVHEYQLNCFVLRIAGIENCGWQNMIRAFWHLCVFCFVFVFTLSIQCDHQNGKQFTSNIVQSFGLQYKRTNLVNFALIVCHQLWVENPFTYRTLSSNATKMPIVFFLFFFFLSVCLFQIHRSNLNLIAAKRIVMSSIRLFVVPLFACLFDFIKVNYNLSK